MSQSEITNFKQNSSNPTEQYTHFTYYLESAKKEQLDYMQLRCRTKKCFVLQFIPPLIFRLVLCFSSVLILRLQLKVDIFSNTNLGEENPALHATATFEEWVAGFDAPAVYAG